MLDDAKHYWVSNDEVDKLIRAGGGWLAAHPEKELITRRYLAHQRELPRRRWPGWPRSTTPSREELDNAVEGAVALDDPDRPVPLAEQRRGAVLAAVRAAGARRVRRPRLRRGRAGPRSARRPRHRAGRRRPTCPRGRCRSPRAGCAWSGCPSSSARRLEIFQSSLTYRDDRLAGLDAAVLMEVIEHVDPPRLDALERVGLRPRGARRRSIVTTPNVEYNVRFETLPAGHDAPPRPPLRVDPRAVPGLGGRGSPRRYGYTVRFLPVGADDPEVGPPTQMAVFTQGAGGPA